MKYILLAILITNTVFAQECKVADTSLYSVHMDGVEELPKEYANKTYTLKHIGDTIMLNNKKYQFYNKGDGVTSYLRGKYLILHSKEHYYLRDVSKDYTWRFICDDTVSTSIPTTNNNIGFLANQKYICVSEGMLIGDKLNPTSQEEAMKYPIRFYIDDNNVMHTDAKLSLSHVRKTIYSNGDYTMWITIKDDKRYLITSNKQLDNLDANIIYVCAETNNWTIARWKFY